MQNMPASSWLLKVEAARAETMVVEAIRVPKEETWLVEVNHLIILVRINLDKSSRWWCKHNNKVVATQAIDTTMVIRLWYEPETKHNTIHLLRGWDLGHWIRMINVLGWT